jgi:hypothetical protein
MSTKSACSMALLAAALALGACSGGDGGGGGGGTTGTGGAGSGGRGGGGGAAAMLPVVASCMAFCNAEDACNPTTTVADCYDYRCTNMTNMAPFAQQPESCRAAYKAYYDCLATQATPCDPVNPSANIPGDCGTQASAIPDANCAGP